MVRKRPSVGRQPAERKMPPVRKERTHFFSLPDAAIWASILCASLMAYWPALRGGLVWDDASHVTSPALESLHGLWRIWFDLGATQQYYPLLHSAFWMEHRIWGDAALGYHLTNVVLHAASACLVVRIVRRLSLPGAWLPPAPGLGGRGCLDAGRKRARFSGFSPGGRLWFPCASPRPGARRI